MRIAEGKYGYFDEQAREYVITRPDTPQPWYNYLINDQDYCALISHTGGGPSYHRSAKFRRLLRYRFNGVPADRPGRYLYLRDMEDGDYWSATWAPVLKPLESFSYRCRVGLNVQTIESEYHGIASSITYFVPPQHPAEVWLVELENRGAAPRRINTYSYAEFNFWGAMRDLLNLDNCPKCARYYHKDGVIVHDSYNDVGTGLDDMHWVKHFAGFTSSEKPVGFNTERQQFLGGIYRSEANPLVVETGQDTNFEGVGDYPICGLTHAWNLAPGRKVKFAFVLAMGDSLEEMYSHLELAHSLETIEHALAGVRSAWNGRLGALHAVTPAVQDFDPCVNTWNQYNSYMTAQLSRSISSYEWGAGRGLGFRDTLQDTMGAAHIDPRLARTRLLQMANCVYSDGIALHNYFPLTRSGDGKDFYDDHLWLPYAVCHYIKETGDLQILKEQVAFWDTGEKQSLLERLALCLDTTWRLRGE
ncbi:hypothetical protein LLH00_03080, partial [bacterium]|nr:hypothetical protein [bacterium]